jgi:hypothetical protein
VPAPTDPERARVAREALRAVYQGPAKGKLLEMYEHIDGMVIAMAWFRKHPEELKRTLSPRKALALCGKG